MMVLPKPLTHSTEERCSKHTYIPSLMVDTLLNHFFNVRVFSYALLLPESSATLPLAILLANSSTTLLDSVLALSWQCYVVRFEGVPELKIFGASPTVAT